jgi:phosphomannomutase
MPPLIMFDLDQTLAESKRPLTTAMAGLLARLLTRTKVAVISGGALPQFLIQVVGQLPADAKLTNFYLLPTSGAALYEWRSGSWQAVYAEHLTKEEATLITRAVREAIQETGVIDLTKQPYGERIEFRESQVTLSALGQQAPIDAKQAWDPDKSKRLALQHAISKRLPDFTVRMGGATSIDVTKKGVDKAFGIRKIADYLHISIPEILYVGDQLVPGGNDEAALSTGAATHAVKNPSETAFFIASLLGAA